MKKPNGYWTKERCHKEALKYSIRKEFVKGSSGAYNAAYKNGWLDEICSHMEIICGKWTIETTKEEALKYNTHIEFSKGSRGAYATAYKNGWLDEICSHMIKGKSLILFEKRKGKKLGYITITGISKDVYKKKNGIKYRRYEYVCDCGNVGTFPSSEYNKRKNSKLKTSCGCNKNNKRDNLLLFNDGFIVCGNCNETKPISDFSKNKSNLNGHQSSCKVCKSKSDKKYRNDPKYKDKLLEKKKEYYFNVVKTDEEYYQNILKRRRETRDYSKEYHLMKGNPLLSFKDTIRKNILSAFRRTGFDKTDSLKNTEQILGCDFNLFKDYIESQFDSSMSWENHGEWHLDHKVPLALATSIEELVKLNHWTNFQPLWAKDNLQKSDKLLDEFISLKEQLLGN